MGLFTKFFFGLKKTQSKLSTEIRRIVSRSPKLTADDIEELEAALLASDMGLAVTQRIINVVRETYESGGGHDGSVLEVAQAEVVSCLGESTGRLAKCDGLTVVLLVGVNGSGTTPTAAANGLGQAGSRVCPLFAERQAPVNFLAADCAKSHSPCGSHFGCSGQAIHLSTCRCDLLDRQIER